MLTARMDFGEGLRIEALRVRGSGSIPLATALMAHMCQLIHSSVLAPQRISG